MSQVIFALFSITYAYSQSPHGPALKIDCATCHRPDSWDFDSKTSIFSHDSTEFALNGQHSLIECRSCHTDLSFDKSKSDCNSCHTDIHQNTVGQTCSRCHTSNSWLVDDVSGLHERANFPLVGVHSKIDCDLCHKSETNLRFGPVGMECIECHRTDFESTTNPNHKKNGFSEDCSSCHSIFGDEWDTDMVNHDFFPLVDAHSQPSCNDCHKSEIFSDISKNCFDCHQKEFESSLEPNHRAAGFSNDCAKCHNLNPGWRPAQYAEHDVLFPIYSGKHQKVWTSCVNCHNNPSDFQSFTCTNCHTNPETDEEHSSVNGYQYQDQACLACHPTGDASEVFNHDATAFPLTGAHRNADCLECHANGFKGTPTQCIACHDADFKNSTNPSHTSLNLDQDCKICHTTDPGWSPAKFDIHNQYYVLEGAHQIISNQCIQCHQGNYNNTPNTCFACHTDDFNMTIDPNHKTNGFSTDCISCHSQSSWIPSTFDHDGRHFPIFSGKHKGEWSQCLDCHTTPGDLKKFSCTVCHQNPETDEEHQGVGGYIYQDPACFACHPTGDADLKFDHNATLFPLTGAHIQANCLECHQNGFKGTSTACVDCHQLDFNQSTDPDHKKLNLTTDCASCHSTAPGWAPARFDIHNQYYVLEGAHQIISNQCVLCHQGNYNNTPNTCFACHGEDFNMTNDPDHKSSGFSTDCISCHSQSSWVPSTFDHDGMHFPIYSGKHKGEWAQCLDCHTTPGEFEKFSCTVCHQNPETDEKHQGVGGYIFQDAACFACHPTGDADLKFDHNATLFPLTGAHVQANCLECHQNGFKGTSTVCVDCHQLDFNQSLDPDHRKLNLSNDCASCHSTTPGWTPAKFDNHDQYYVLQGAHKMISQDCKACHISGYNNTPNTCVGCHQAEFDNSQNPNHRQAQFPTDCKECHGENAWTPAQFDHDGKYFPIYSGKHKGVWSQCNECHTNPNNFAVTSCVICHMNPETDEKHMGVGGYVYQDQACLACHPTGDADVNFDHNTTMFPLTGAHLQANCLECHKTGFKGTSTICVDCHQMDFDQSKDPDHKKIGLSTDCVSCHSTNPGWTPAKFDVHDQYYVLDGAHLSISQDCKRCHINGYSNTPNTCVGCHQQDYDLAQDPNHQNLNIPNDCVTCHSTAPGWRPASFGIHDQFYPLLGKHKDIATECVKCHQNGYNNTPNTCVGCHQSDFDQTTNPNHVNAGFPTDCAACHNENGWAPSTFMHDALYFPIYSGKHLNEWDECVDCHTNPTDFKVFTCTGCHLNPETDNKHNGVGGYVYQSNACFACHPTGEKNMAFDHNNSRFPLTGAHINVDCIECHQNGYQNTPLECVACHQNDYDNSQNPNHNSLNLSTDCISCHTTVPGWMPARFDNHDQYYVLDGAHDPIRNNCTVCHNGNYNNTPNTCVGCHQTDYNSSVNPNHNSLNIPTDCANCHTTAPGWSPAGFDIHDQYYVLDGAHDPIRNNCNVCHNGNYTNTPNTCVGCHQSDYNSSTNPNHNALNIPTDCASCHTTAPGWAPASFSIHDNYYPLLGAHAQIANECVTCHMGNYNNTPNTCYGCHQDDYNNTTNPDHQSAQFPTNCTNCHSQNAWVPSTFDHDAMYFPIYSGSHENEWNNCNECHSNPNNYSIFQCLTCHPKNETDSDHNGVNNYSYNSNACYSCHPDGEE